MPEDNGKQNPEESYTNKYQNYLVWSYDYKSVCVDDKFTKHLAKMQVTILLIIWSKKVTITVMWWEKKFNKELVMTK